MMPFQKFFKVVFEYKLRNDAQTADLLSGFNRAPVHRIDHRKFKSVPSKRKRDYAVGQNKFISQNPRKIPREYVVLRLT